MFIDFKTHHVNKVSQLIPQIIIITPKKIPNQDFCQPSKIKVFLSKILVTKISQVLHHSLSIQ